MKVDVARIQALNPFLIRGNFDSKLQEFKLRMMTQIINILSPFLTFALAYNQADVHNIMAIMLDLWFKNMKVIWDFVGHAHAIQIVTNFDFGILCPFFLYHKCFLIWTLLG